MPDRSQIELLATLEKLQAERRASDPLFQWEPLPKQKPFIESVLHAKKLENWFIAANRSGKSDSGAFIGACLARFGSDPKVAYSSGGQIEVRDRATAGLVSSLTFPMSRNIIEPKYFDNGFSIPGEHQPFIPAREVLEWRASDRVLKLKSGSIVYFLSQETGRAKYQGIAVDWAHLDEEHAEDVVNEIRIRVGGGKRLRIFGTATMLPPEGQVGGVTWLFAKVIQPFLAGKLKDTGLFGASIYDNPHIPPEMIAKLETQYADNERRIRLGGEWLPGLSGARAYHAFSRELHLRELAPINLYRPLAWVWDFNVEPMVSIVGQREGRIFRVYRTLTMDEGNISEMCQYFIDQFPRHNAEIWVYGDATGKNRTAQTGVSCYQIIQNTMRTYGAPVRLRVPEANPAVPDRINALNMALKNELGEISVEIAPEGNDELIADLEQVLRDGRGGIKKTFDKKDPYFRRTHTSDALGYWVSYEAPVRANVQSSYGVQGVKIAAPGYVFAK